MIIKIEKDIFVRDKFKVRRQAFKAGQEVELNVYNAVLSSNAVVNPEDLPQTPVKVTRSIETKMLEPTAKTLAEETVVRSEEEAEPPREVAPKKETVTKKETVKKTEAKKKTD